MRSAAEVPLSCRGRFAVEPSADSFSLPQIGGENTNLELAALSCGRSPARVGPFAAKSPYSSTGPHRRPEIIEASKPSNPPNRLGTVNGRVQNHTTTKGGCFSGFRCDGINLQGLRGQGSDTSGGGRQHYTRNPSVRSRVALKSAIRNPQSVDPRSSVITRGQGG